MPENTRELDSSSEEPADKLLADTPPDEGQLSFPVVGIGASAGGLGAFETFLEHLPEDPGMVFVLVQHLDPDRKSELPEILQRATAMDVAHIEEDGGMALERNRIYVIPPARNLAIEDGQLHLSEMTEPRAERAPIDYFFRSLADSQDGNAVGVVLSGTGSGGTNGLRRIKERGGITLVQDPDEAEFEGMPQSAIRMGMVDVVAPVRELAEKLAQYRDAHAQIRLPDGDGDLSNGDEEVLAGVFETVHERVGHDFSQYKRSTMLRRIERRMQVNQATALRDYLDVLRENEDEAQALFKDLLITVTRFFRDEDAFTTLWEQVVPRLFEDKGASDTVRVWATGCATGEEAYSLAILLREHADTLAGPTPEVQVFATDLGEEAVHAAREGFFSEDIAADLSEERLNRFFEKEPGGYRVRRSIREWVIFARHDLMADPPFSRLDLVVCRNLLIYLKREAQERLFDVFHYALRPGGYLFLGSAESVASAQDLFRAIHQAHRIYRRRDDVARPPQFGEMPFITGGRKSTTQKAEDTPVRSSPSSFEDARLRVLEEYVPPGMMVSPENEIVHVFQGGNRYLRVAPGAPTYDVLETIRPALRSALRTALFQARQDGEETRSRAVALEIGGRPRRVRCVARPVKDAAFIQVVFERAGEQDGEASLEAAAAPAETADERNADARHAETDQLEEQLTAVRRELQSTVEEYENAMEKQRASNEELQSMNEELRSTTEELETSKEELQSMNEELTTVNEELNSKNEELSRVNSDLQNLFTSTEIATLFLDRDLRIQRFTPRAEELFNVIESDRGRSVEHVTRRFDHTDFEYDAQQVLETLIPIEHEVQNDEGQWFLMRLRPYRTVENKIDGVVVTFVEITERKKTQQQIRRAKEYTESIIDTVREPLLVLNAGLRVQSANQSFYDTFRERPAGAEGELIYELGDGQWDIPALRRLLGEVLPENKVFTDFVVEHDFGQIGRRCMVLNARQVQGADLILLAIEDETERRQAEEALRLSEERYRLLVESAEEYAMFMMDREGRITSWSEGAARIFGYAEQEAVGQPGAMTFTEEDQVEGALQREMRIALETGQASNERWHVRKDGSRFWGSGVVTALEEDGALRGFAKVMRDNTDRKRRKDLLEERVVERTGEVRDLAHALTEAEEHERRRIAAVLHDDVQQQIYGAEMTVRRGRRLLENRLDDDTVAEVKKMCDQLGETLDTAVETTRTLSTELSPTVLRDEDLGSVLLWLIDHMKERYQLNVDADVREAPRIENRDLRALLFRVSRELLFNVVKHAGTGRAHLEAGLEDGTLVLRVSDDGAGFEVETLQQKDSGYGLAHMRERLRLLEGRLEVETAPGEGTRVAVYLPGGFEEE